MNLESENVEEGNLFSAVLSWLAVGTIIYFGKTDKGGEIRAWKVEL